MISHADILWILGLGMEYNLMDKAESLSEIADVVHYRLAMKYRKSREWRLMHPLVWKDEVEADMTITYSGKMKYYELPPDLGKIVSIF